MEFSCNEPLPDLPSRTDLYEWSGNNFVSVTESRFGPYQSFFVFALDKTGEMWYNYS